MKKISNYPSPLFKRLVALSSQYNRIAITGRPHSGKTVATKMMSEHCSHNLVHTDDHMDGTGFRQDWGTLIDKLNSMNSFIVEGVSVARLLEQGLKVDYIIAVQQSTEPKPEHVGFSKAIFTILNRLPITYETIVNDIIIIS